MKKVYAVNAGSYSDYRVEAIFSTRKLAEAFMQAAPSSDYNEISVFELDPPTADLINRGYEVWQVHMLIDGATEVVQKTDTDLYAVTTTGHSIWRRTQAPAYKGKGIPDILTSKVWAKTKKQAIKIVNEQRTQMIAMGEWGISGGCK